MLGLGHLYSTKKIRKLGQLRVILGKVNALLVPEQEFPFVRQLYS